MDDYAAWRNRVLHGARLSSPQGAALPEPGPATSLASPPPPPPSLQPPPPPTAPAAAPPRRDESSTAAAPLPFSSAVTADSDDAAGAVARLAEVLRDIAATERRHAKTWLNVQPCVLHAVKLLAATAQTCVARVHELEEALRQAQQCVNVLVRDREVKEERYRLDAAAHRAEADELWRRLLMLEASAAAPQVVAAPPHEVPSSVAAAISASCAHTVEARVAPLEQELRRLRREFVRGASSRRRRDAEQPRAAYDGSVDSDTASAPTPPPPPPAARTGNTHKSAGLDARAAVPPPRRALSSASSASALSSSQESARGAGYVDDARVPRAADTMMMMREVQRLRRQWRQFLRSVPGATVIKGPGEGAAAGADAEGPRRGASRRFSSEGEGLPRWATSGGALEREDEGDAWDVWRDGWARPLSRFHRPQDPPAVEGSDAAGGTPLPSSGRRVRWYWSGDAQSRFSTATRRAGVASWSASTPAASPAQQGSASPPLPWTEYHAFDGRTDCWYSLGTWAAHRRQLREVAEAERSAAPDARLGWMASTTSLLRWLEPATVGVVRAGVYAVRVCLVRHCASASLSGGAGRVDGGSGGDGGALSLWVDGVPVQGMQEAVTHILLYADGRRSPSPPSRAGIAHSTAQRRRACCEPAQLHTNTLSAHLFLPAGATLQVRCRGLHDTKTIHEAFCELECVV